ncbi:MAG: phosphopantothenoylcysteine decarboxylase [Oscillospiraceae bacterium]|nr:phosphopantothenoylcysteine decarboxylase [Oscillospiraceae bacterium]
MSNSAINILITAGGTSEPIDNVRRIANTGTGRLGSLIADEFSANSSVDRIFYVCARDSVRPASEKVTCVEIQSVNDLEAAVTQIAGCCPIHAIIHSMAVSDFRVRAVSTVGDLADFLQRGASPDRPLPDEIERGMDEGDLRAGAGKLSSQMHSPLILLEPTQKVIPLLRGLAKDAVIVGFKLLNQVSEEDLLDTAHRLLVKNGCDFVLANDSAQIEGDRHHGYLLDADKNVRTFETKQEIARGIVQTVLSEVAKK